MSRHAVSSKVAGSQEELSEWLLNYLSSIATKEGIVVFRYEDLLKLTGYSLPVVRGSLNDLRARKHVADYEIRTTDGVAFKNPWHCVRIVPEEPKPMTLAEITRRFTSLVDTVGWAQEEIEHLRVLLEGVVSS